uniref:ASPIC/UnbV domain-containing protein n=1 Tax=Rhodosorus marinus TaxID=101924 RepID=A0A7S3E6E3_9RHOD|mmetsp:Transcript_12894/g.51467  ORF Transcript_12894/g.51467 Transcript_12894/m.51467 type:complete len:573 (+) Transcript_12894:157-1875(+)
MDAWSVLLVLGLVCVASSARTLRVPVFEEVGERIGLRKYTLAPNKTEFKLENKYWGMSLCDVNRDGRYEMILGNHGDGLEFWWADKNDNYEFQSPGLYRRDIHGTACADLDNDGDLDVIVTRGGRNGKAPGTGLILEGLPPRDFQKLEEGGGEKFGLGEQFIRGRSAAFFDATGKGDLDLLYVNRRIPGTVDDIHLFYENMGDGRFAERKLGFELTNSAWFSLVDYNEDGYMDIILMLLTSIELWRGTGRFSFVKVENAFPNGGADIQGAHCNCEIDFDRDGDMDLYMARGRIKEDKIVSDILWEKRDNIYYPISEERGLPVGGRHYHATCGDFNNDGHVDIFVSRATLFKAAPIPDLLLMNLGDGSFRGVSGTALDRNLPPNSDGNNAMAYDYNLDGRLDVLVGRKNASWSLYENTSTRARNFNYILVRVGAPRASVFYPAVRRSPLNAMVKVTCDGVVHLRRVAASGQSHSQSYFDTLHFGLGSCQNVQKIEVKYAGGVTVQRTGNLRANRIFESGLYFPCLPNKAGKGCKETIQPCVSKRWLGYPNIEYEETTSPDMDPIYCPMTGRQF